MFEEQLSALLWIWSCLGSCLELRDISENACRVIRGEDVEKQQIGVTTVIRGAESPKCSVDHLWGACAEDLNQATPESFNNYYDVNQRGERVMLLITSFMLCTQGDKEEISTRNVQAIASAPTGSP